MVAPVRVRFFATAREAVGRATVPWEVPSQGIAAGTLVGQIAQRYPALSPLLRHCRLVRNHDYVQSAAELIRPGDEFGIHPPYSGG